ncbi:MAG: hypothetical protein HUJ65_06510, partial [Oscillospiraceae bacterium]|nr:hypothetical protein [Oscillospiraceae bacterium]
FNNLFYNKAPIPGEYETGYIENDDYCNAQFHADMDHRENGYVMVLQYQARRFSEADAGRLIDRYFDLVKKLMESGAKKLSDIGLKQF